MMKPFDFVLRLEVEKDTILDIRTEVMMFKGGKYVGKLENNGFQNCGNGIYVCCVNFPPEGRKCDEINICATPEWRGKTKIALYNAGADGHFKRVGEIQVNATKKISLLCRGGIYSSKKGRWEIGDEWTHCHPDNYRKAFLTKN